MLYVSKKISIFAVPNHIAEALWVEVSGWAHLHTGVYCAFVSACRNPENSNVSLKQSNVAPPSVYHICLCRNICYPSGGKGCRQYGDIYSCVGLRRCSSSTGRAISGASTPEAGISTAPRFCMFDAISSFTICCGG